MKLQPLRTHVVLFGIEAHVCVLQTAMDLIRHGYTVHLVSDTVSSQNICDREAAFDRFRSYGQKLLYTSAESVVFEILKDAQHPKFKDIARVVKDFATRRKARL